MKVELFGRHVINDGLSIEFLVNIARKNSYYE